MHQNQEQNQTTVIKLLNFVSTAVRWYPTFNLTVDSLLSYPAVQRISHDVILNADRWLHAMVQAVQF